MQLSKVKKVYSTLKVSKLQFVNDHMIEARPWTDGNYYLDLYYDKAEYSLVTRAGSINLTKDEYDMLVKNVLFKPEYGGTSIPSTKTDYDQCMEFAKLNYKRIISV